MTLSRKIADALDENTCALTVPCSASIDDGEHTMTLRLTALDAVGVAFDALELAPRKAREWSEDAIRAWGSNLSSRVTYLMEPLKVLELDAGGGDLQIRSQAPTHRGDRRGFYEVRIDRRGTLRLARFAFDEATRQRYPIPCQMTREVLERLADDLVASIPA